MELLKQKAVLIDGHEYRIRQLGALSGRRVWLMLAKVLAAPLRELSKQPSLSEVSIAGALAAGLESISESQLEELCTIFGEKCEVRVGEKWPRLDPALFDIHFASRYVSMSKWLWECVAFNFLDFLGDASLGSIVAQARQKAEAAASASKSQKNSTGSSGES